MLKSQIICGIDEIITVEILPHYADSEEQSVRSCYTTKLVYKHMQCNVHVIYPNYPAYVIGELPHLHSVYVHLCH